MPLFECYSHIYMYIYIYICIYIYIANKYENIIGIGSHISLVQVFTAEPDTISIATQFTYIPFLFNIST